MIAEASPNIAFIKYWGKKPSTQDEDRNMALNPSLSLTLSQARTRAQVQRASKNLFEIQGQAASELDQAKLRAHILRVCKALGQPEQSFSIRSENNFPKGTGIASSASAFAALTLAITGEILGRSQAEDLLKNEGNFLSRLARRGSGSASRSVAGPFMKWDGESAQVIPSNWKLYDSILIFSREEKKVSSSDGHQLALSSPDFQKRLQKIPARLAAVEAAISEKNLGLLGPVLETEADEMHQIAATSQPPVHYALASTLKFLKILREQKHRNFYYTLDAGPNVHLISERPVKEEILAMLQEANLEAEIWEDWTGQGPVLISDA